MALSAIDPFGKTLFLAQFNLGTTPATYLGIVLLVAGVGLFAIRSWRPNLSRDYDVFFSAIALVCGGILIFNGWRLDPLLQLGQFLIVSSAIFFAWESIRMRALSTQQAKRGSRSPNEEEDGGYDDGYFERPVSRVYRAEFDDAPASDRGSALARRMRGNNEYRGEREEDYDYDARRRPPRRRSNDSGYDREYGAPYENRPRRRPRSDGPESSPRDRSRFDEPSAGGYDTRSDRDDFSPPRRRPPRPAADGRPRRPRPPEEEERSPRRDPTADIVGDSPSDYVDYKPIDFDRGAKEDRYDRESKQERYDEETDKPSNFDE